MSVIEWSSTRTASEGHATVGKNPVTVHRRIDDLITWGLSPVACLLPRPYRAGTVPGFLANPYRAGTVPGFLPATETKQAFRQPTARGLSPVSCQDAASGL
jgi:hypothetical protein